ncbi:AbrB/MazE/SpoVT family DNA-binding domain-containing protein [Candidatus Acetothermia bacterium]|nr:AbrB/MazE/SpoVT family DNA-binding domain-containing protein [Candidatus Acetothermia bacterium]MBI3459533.1 AbrB/MazE/SpoVT family DNA-binding domain-containing protein [Candidatus Acetothermia bacterium]
MPLVKVMDRRLVVIPKELYDKLSLNSGDYLEVDIVSGKLVYSPKTLVDRDPWYWSAEGQKRMKESFDDVKEGRVKRFKSAQALIKDLNR